MLNITHSHVMLPLILWLPLFYHYIVHVPNSKVSCQYWNGRYDVLMVLPHGRIKNEKKLPPFTQHHYFEYNLWEQQKIVTISKSDYFFMQCHGFVMYDSRFTTCTYKFFKFFFFLLSLYYINLNFDCPFNTKVIQTLNDEFKSQKTL